jgi:hypothetical protein
MVKQVAKLVKVRFVDDLTDCLRMGVSPYLSALVLHMHSRAASPEVCSQYSLLNAVK